MKTFRIQLTQDMIGYYVGEFIVEAESEEEVQQIVGAMSKEELDAKVDWEHSDHYEGLINTTDVEDITEI